MIDKIISFFPAELLEAHREVCMTAEQLPAAPDAFLKHAASQFGRIEEVDLAFPEVISGTVIPTKPFFWKIF